MACGDEYYGQKQREKEMKWRGRKFFAIFKGERFAWKWLNKVCQRNQWISDEKQL